MKKIAAILAVLLGFQASAFSQNSCPNLVGTFTNCLYENNDGPLHLGNTLTFNIEQSVQNEATVYSVSSVWKSFHGDEKKEFTAITDGVLRASEEKFGSVTIQSTVTWMCNESQALKTETLKFNYSDGTSLERNATSKYSRDEKGNLKISETYGDQEQSGYNLLCLSVVQI